MRLQQEQIISGRYQINQLIGTGSGGEIYKVWDNKRSVYLALKLLHPELNFDDEWLYKFNQEALALSRLQHPNIVRFYELVQADGYTFYLMDFVDGKTLRNELQHATEHFELDKVILLLRPVCGALQYAHQHGITHCDVKPENILIDRKGGVFLTDFGISLQREKKVDTLGGLGTPSYMSPEQIQSKGISPQTDIYALGIILFELCTLFRPFTGQNAPITYRDGDRIRWEHLNLRPPKPSSLNPALPSGVDSTVLRCLEKDPANRFQNCMDIIQSLEILDRKSHSSPPPSQKEIDLALEIIEHKNKFQNIRKLIIPFAIFITLIFIVIIMSGKQNRGNSLLHSNSPVVNPLATYEYSNACIEIVIDQASMTRLFECVTSINPQSTGELKVNINWSVSSISNSRGVVVYSDQGNHNMYLLDNYGNRLDHNSTGGGTNQEVTLFNGDSKDGWFIFAAPEKTATSFYFVDDDNNGQSPRLDRQWP